MKAKLRFYKESWSSNQRPLRNVLVSLPIIGNDRKKLLQAIAKNWGDIDRQKTLYNTPENLAMSFSCEAHGGFILFTNEPLEFWSPSLSSNDFNFNEQWFVYTFEEDEQWAVLYSMLPFHAKEKVVKGTKYTVSETDDFAKKEIERSFSELKSEIEKEKARFILNCE